MQHSTHTHFQNRDSSRRVAGYNRWRLELLEEGDAICAAQHDGPTRCPDIRQSHAARSLWVLVQLVSRVPFESRSQLRTLAVSRIICNESRYCAESVGVSEMVSSSQRCCMTWCSSVIFSFILLRVHKGSIIHIHTVSYITIHCNMRCIHCADRTSGLKNNLGNLDRLHSRAP